MRNLRAGFAAFAVLAVYGVPPGAMAESDVAAAPAQTVAQNAQSQSDMYIPPPRGTPDGRISGGTRGLSKVTGSIPPSSGSDGSATIGSGRQVSTKPRPAPTQ